MPYTDLLSRAFEIVRRNRALWIIGMMYAFFGGGGGGSANFQGNFDNSSFGSGNSPDLPAWLTPEFLISLAVIAGVVGFLLAIVFFVLRSTAYTGLVHGTRQALNDEVPSWRALWSAGWSPRGRRIMGLRFLLAIPSLVLVLIAIATFFVALFPFVQAMISNESPESMMPQIAGGFFLGICLFICLIGLTIVVQLVLNMAGNYASRFIILEDHSIGEGWRQGWSMFRRHIVESVVMSVILGVIGAVIGFIIAIPLTLLAFVFVLPLAFSGGFEALSSISAPLLVVGGILGALAISLLTSLLVGPVLAYSETVWTLVYRHYKAQEAPVVPPAPTMA